MSRRANASVLGITLLLGCTVVLAASVGTLALAIERPPVESPPQVAVTASVDADAGRVVLRHVAGDALDVRDLAIRVAVDGTALAHQPPVPFFAAPGFRGGPTGPFNAAADPRWTPGETASVRLAATNDPPLEPGARVRIRLLVGGREVAAVTAVA